MADLTYKGAQTQNELVPGTPAGNQEQITGAEVVGATSATNVDSGWTFANYLAWIKLDADWMSKATYDSNGDGTVDAAGELKDGTNTVTAAQARSHIDDTTIHFIINDGSTAATVAWSASKISTELGEKADQSSLDSHTGDLTIHRALNDAITTTINLWSADKIDTDLGAKADQSALDSHTGDLSIHRELNDSLTTTTNLWSGSKIDTELSGKAAAADLTAHENNTANPHSVTHAQASPGDVYSHSQIDSHIPSDVHLDTDERAGIDNMPNAPTAINPFASQADLSAFNLTDAEFPTYAVFNNHTATSGAIDFATAQKQKVDAATYSFLTVAPSVSGKPANYSLVIFNSGSIASLAPAAGGVIHWQDETPPSWSDDALLSLAYDGVNWTGSAATGITYP